MYMSHSLTGIYKVMYCHLLILLDDCGVSVNVFDLRFAGEDY